MPALDKITIKGFKSIRSTEGLELKPLNVLIGANGAGKSNFIGVFKLLNEIVQENLQVYVGKSGGADQLLYYGIHIHLQFGQNAYECTLTVLRKKALSGTSCTPTSAIKAFWRFRLLSPRNGSRRAPISRAASPPTASSGKK
jgi:predicted ATPase